MNTTTSLRAPNDDDSGVGITLNKRSNDSSSTTNNKNTAQYITRWSKSNGGQETCSDVMSLNLAHLARGLKEYMMSADNNKIPEYN